MDASLKIKKQMLMINTIFRCGSFRPSELEFFNGFLN